MDAVALQKVLKDPDMRGRAHAARYVRGDGDYRQALETAIKTVIDQPWGNDSLYLLKEAVMSLVALPEAESTVALCNLMLRQENRDLKDPVLRQPPSWSGLKSGMEFVSAEKYGWQEGAANNWLEEH